MGSSKTLKKIIPKEWYMELLDLIINKNISIYDKYEDIYHYLTLINNFKKNSPIKINEIMLKLIKYLTDNKIIILLEEMEEIITNEQKYYVIKKYCLVESCFNHKYTKREITLFKLSDMFILLRNIFEDLIIGKQIFYISVKL